MWKQPVYAQTAPAQGGRHPLTSDGLRNRPRRPIRIRAVSKRGDVGGQVVHLGGLWEGKREHLCRTWARRNHIQTRGRGDADDTVHLG